MFSLINRPLVNPIMAKFIRDSTNKSLEKYKKNVFLDYEKKVVTPNFLILLPVLSLIYILAGYRN
jgi:hypothetical protein